MHNKLIKFFSPKKLNWRWQIGRTSELFNGMISFSKQQKLSPPKSISVPLAHIQPPKEKKNWTNHSNKQSGKWERSKETCLEEGRLDDHREGAAELGIDDEAFVSTNLTSPQNKKTKIKWRDYLVLLWRGKRDERNECVWWWEMKLTFLRMLRRSFWDCSLNLQQKEELKKGGEDFRWMMILKSGAIELNRMLPSI